MSSARKATPQPAADSAAALAEAIEVERDRLAAAEARQAELVAQHSAAIMLDGNDPELDQLEAELEIVGRAIARHRAKISAFHDRLLIADAEERERERRQTYTAAAAEVAAARDWLIERYPALAAEMAAGLSRLRSADQLARRVNDDSLPTNADRLQPPSLARHQSASDAKIEQRQEPLWVDQNGRPAGALQLRDGKPPHGFRLESRETEVEVPGRPPWFPQPLWQEVKLPRLHRDDEDFWIP